MLKFNDGMEFDTQGEYRVELRRDGYYVVGHGMLLAVDDRADGEVMIRRLQGNRDARQGEVAEL